MLFVGEELSYFFIGNYKVKSLVAEHLDEWCIYAGNAQTYSKQL